MAVQHEPNTTVDYSLYYVTGRHLLPPGKDFYESLREALQGGVTIVQLREKDVSTREFLDIGKKCKVICDEFKVPLLINDRLDIALSLSCGLHVGQSDLPSSLARSLLGPSQLLGVSVNTPSELTQVLEEGVVDYVGIGPAYETRSKGDLNPILGTRGVARILEALGESKIKAVVIGGITAQTIPNVLRQCSAPLPSAPTSQSAIKYRTLDGLAVISAIAASPHPKEASANLLRLFRAGPQYPFFLVRPSGVKPTTTTSASLIDDACTILTHLRKERTDDTAPKPLIHHITNLVVQNDTANLTLALSCSPIMSSSSLESRSLSKLISCLLLNFGTINQLQLDAHREAGLAANEGGKPIVFDPVGVGATEYRRREAEDLLSAVHMSIIKGNAGEIGTLYGSKEVKSRGVDSVGKGFKDPSTIVRELARREKLVVAMTGPIDYISDGTTVISISNGHHYQSVITGSGCMASTAVAAFASSASTSSSSSSMLSAAVAGILAINVAAEIAAERSDVKGPNTFRAALIDECYNLSVEEIRKRARIEVGVV